jgi:hypothetical protein
LAPPVGLLASPVPEPAFSVAFSFSPAEVPPAGELVAEPPPAFADSELASLLLASLPEDPLEAAPVDVLVDVVEVMTPAAFSALVSVGGMISGVVLGTASATLLPPHPETPTPHSIAAEAASAARAAQAPPDRGRWMMEATS